MTVEEEATQSGSTQGIGACVSVCARARVDVRSALKDFYKNMKKAALCLSNGRMEAPPTGLVMSRHKRKQT